MSLRFKFFIPSAFAVMLCALPAFSQTVFVQGNVKGPDGAAVPNALVIFQNLDTNNKMQAKTDKKGHYVLPLPPTNYNVSVTVDGKVREKIDKYDAGNGSGDPLNFDLKPTNLSAAAADAEAAAAAAGKGKNGAPVDKEQQKAAQEREAKLAKDKALNDSFAAGTAAIAAKQWDEAITQLTKASEIGPKQIAVWASLAQAYVGSANAAKSTAEKTPIYDKAFAAFDQAIALAPTEAGSYNNYALALAEDNKLPEAKEKLAKAVEIDPPNAGKYHYNLGALLMNSGQGDAATDEFKKAIDADPNYAEAYFYYGSSLLGKATTDAATGKMVPPPGTIEALQKYIQLKPDGPNAPAAKEMIEALGSTISVNYKDPNAPAKKKK